MKATEQKLKQVLADQLDIPVESVGENTSPDTVPTWDSMHHLRLVLALENAFDVSLTEEQVVEVMNYPLIKIVLQELGVEF